MKMIAARKAARLIPGVLAAVPQTECRRFRCLSRSAFAGSPCRVLHGCRADSCRIMDVRSHLFWRALAKARTRHGSSPHETDKKPGRFLCRVLRGAARLQSRGWCVSINRSSANRSLRPEQASRQAQELRPDRPERAARRSLASPACRFRVLQGSASRAG